jgi:muconate cycloisomerase
MPIRHNLAEHRSADNLVVRVTTDGGVTGFGEGVPRDFVTGESLAESIRRLEAELIPGFAGFDASDPPQLKEMVSERLADSLSDAPAASCALELAVFDAAGKTWGLPMAGFFGPTRQQLVYSAIVPLLGPEGFEDMLHLVRGMRMPFAKIKVGRENDVAYIAQARRILGDGVDLRIDANGAWGADEAVDRILEMLPYGISAVEQPVAKEDIAGMLAVAQKIPIPVVADESLCTERDAERLIELGPRLMFNLRLSKCGGALAVDRLFRLGHRHGITCQLGCQVGESGILSAAGRQMALTREFVYLEGSYSRFMLKEDIVRESVDIGRTGVALPLPGNGLGISVRPDSLARLSVSHVSYRL